MLQVFAERSDLAACFSTRLWRLKISRAGPRQAKIASAPTTPSCAKRGIHSWMRPGNSVNTSRHSPKSTASEPSALARGRQTRWTDEASAAEPIAQASSPFRVDGPRAGDNPTCIDQCRQKSFPTCCRFVCKHDDTNPRWDTQASALRQRQLHTTFIELGVLVRVANWVPPFHLAQLFSFVHGCGRKQCWKVRFQITSKPKIEEVGQVGIRNCVVIWRVRYSQHKGD